MEQNEISQHEVEVYRVLRLNPTLWMTNIVIAERAPAISPRTVRAKTAKFVALGLIDVAEVFPGHRYRLSDKGRQRNAAYLTRLENAASVFGIELDG